METNYSNDLCELDFNHLIYFAYKRYIEGVQTIDLMQLANSDREREEIALVSLLDVQTDVSIALSYHRSNVDINRIINKIRRTLNAELALGKFRGQ